MDTPNDDKMPLFDRHDLATIFWFVVKAIVMVWLTFNVFLPWMIAERY